MNKPDMPESFEAGELAFAGDAEAAAAASLTSALALPRPASGLYETSLINSSGGPVPLPVPGNPTPPEAGSEPGGFPRNEADGESTARNDGTTIALTLRREQLRLDVDGRYPQRTASGTFYGPTAPMFHWIATLANTAANTWSGNIWFKDGNVATFPYTRVTIKVLRSVSPTSATIVYSGGGAAPLTRTLPYKSPYYRPLNLEFDCAQGVTAVTDIQTNAHPNRPATLPNETLTLQTVFRRAGFSVGTNSSSIVPIAGAGANARWSDQEMHDAMQVYWSRFANAPQAAFWTLFASLHEDGTSLGGVMFDDIGPNHRQGTAIFVDSFIANPPSGDPAPAAWVRRMRFWTAVHEMGHTFNLAHSWQKDLGTPWIPLANDPEGRTFMNYPFRVTGGQSAFFANFTYRFSDQELLFLRHAPERYVMQGNADWFDHHGFQRDRVSAEPTFALEIRTPRMGANFEFLEPVVLDLKLTNISDEPQLVDQKVLANSEEMTVIIKKKGKPARQYVSFTHRFYQPKAKALAPGQSIADSLFAAVGRNGWDLAEPGEYRVQIALHLEDEDILSTPLLLRIERPRSYEEENFATDFFSDDVGRVLAFDGSRTLARACDTLREATERMKSRRVAVHARVALGTAKSRNSKILDLRDADSGQLRSAAAAGARIQVAPADEREARDDLEVLTKDATAADQTLGRIDYAYYLEEHKDLLGVRSTEARILEIPMEPVAAMPTGILRRGSPAISRTGRATARSTK
jgi:hypothetical protein